MVEIVKNLKSYCLFFFSIIQVHSLKKVSTVYTPDIRKKNIYIYMILENSKSTSA